MLLISDSTHTFNFPDDAVEQIYSINQVQSKYKRVTEGKLWWKKTEDVFQHYYFIVHFDSGTGRRWTETLDNGNQKVHSDQWKFRFFDKDNAVEQRQLIVDAFEKMLMKRENKQSISEPEVVVIQDDVERTVNRRDAISDTE